MKKSSLNWQQKAQETIYESIKEMTLEEELAFWQQETARLRERQQQIQSDANHRQRLITLLAAYPPFRASAQTKQVFPQTGNSKPITR